MKLAMRNSDNSAIKAAEVLIKFELITTIDERTGIADKSRARMGEYITDLTQNVKFCSQRVEKDEELAVKVV